MKRVWGQVLTGLTVAGAIASAGAVIAACSHDDSTIFVSQVIAPQFVTQGEECVYTADPTQPHLTSGGLDVGLRSQYDAVFLVGNQIVPQGNPTQPQTETSFVTIQGGVVRITDTSGNQLTTYTTLASVTIPPSSGTTPGYAAVSLTIVDQATATGLGVMTFGDSRRVVSYVRFFGQTLGGDSVESGEFGFPVDVCYGCLVGYSAMDISPNFPTPNCVGNGSSSSSTITTSVPCVLGQDFQTDCTACQGYPVCDRNDERDGGVD